MANERLTELTNLAAPTRDDLLYVVNDPGGVPASRKATLESLITGPGILVAASDAPANATKNADYICDGTDDDVQIQAALDDLDVTGGIVLLSTGTFVLSAAVTLATTQHLIGSGHATVLSGGAGYDDNMAILATRTSIERMSVLIPTTTTHDAIAGANCSAFTLRDLRFTGGNSASIYAISLSNFFFPNLDSIIISTSTSGVKLANTDNLYNYGNGSIRNVYVNPLIAAHKGWYIVGNTTKNVNLLSFEFVGCVGAAGTAAGSIGVHIVNSSYLTMNMLNLEVSAMSLQLDGNVGGGPLSNGNVFCGMYIGEDVSIDNQSNFNTFVGGKIFGVLTDNGIGTGYYGTQN